MMNAFPFTIKHLGSVQHLGACALLRANLEPTLQNTRIWV